MRQTKIFINLLLLTLFLFFSLNINSWAQSTLIIDANESKCAWEKDIITNREVIFVDKPFIAAEIQTNIPIAGKYQLLAYVHHNWRKVTPCIYVEAVDSEGNKHKGYHKIENIWYLSQESKGRWFFVTLSQNPYWNLPKGKLYLKVWVAGNNSPYDNIIVPMEGRVSIEKFFLIPVIDNNSGSYLPGVSYPESGEGDWNISYYYPKYATNLIEANSKGSLFSCKATVPISRRYQIWLSVLSPLNNSLEMTVKNKFKKNKFNIKFDGKDEWITIPIQTLYLEKGRYSIVFKNLGPNKIMIDFFMILPISEDSKPRTSS